MPNKRYYWLRFRQDFFKSLRIKKLRKLAGGDTFTIIYLKMQLLALNTDGYLEYRGVFNSFEEEVAEDIDEDVENVTITIQYLLSVGLLEKEGDEYALPYVQENLGSESASTQRARTCRNRAKLLQCNTDATQVQHLCSVEIDIEKEKEIDIELETEKKEKKKKEKKPAAYFPNDEKLNAAFLDYVEMRKKIKKPMTDRAADLAIKKLEELSGGDNDTAIAILDQSVMNSWQGLFELKGQRRQQRFGSINWDEV